MHKKNWTWFFVLLLYSGLWSLELIFSLPFFSYFLFTLSSLRICIYRKRIDHKSRTCELQLRRMNHFMGCNKQTSKQASMHACNKVTLLHDCIRSKQFKAISSSWQHAHYKYVPCQSVSQPTIAIFIECITINRIYASITISFVSDCRASWKLASRNKCEKNRE